MAQDWHSERWVDSVGERPRKKLYNLSVQTLFIFGILGLTLLLLLFLLRERREGRLQGFSLLQGQIEALRIQVGESISATVQSLNQQFSSLTQNMNLRLKEITDQILSTKDSTSLLMADVKENLGSIAEASKRIMEIGRDIASLQDILKTPKLRGSLGELFLGDLLSQILPQEFYTLQYRFRNNVFVDAVVKLKEGLVPIDSKFPLSSFRSLLEAKDDDERKIARKKFAADVKRHIDEIALRYIQPKEGTFDFALMYIPAENVYYETIIKDESQGQESLFAYALEKRVVPVSPNTFYAYLQTILLGLKGMRIEEMAKGIVSAVSALQLEFSKIEEDVRTLGNHIQNARRKYEEIDRKIEKMKERLSDLALTHLKEEKKILAKPSD